MAKITEKTIKKLKNKSIFPSISFFLFTLIFGLIMVTLSSAAIISYIIESRYAEKSAEATEIVNQIAQDVADGVSYTTIVGHLEHNMNKPLSVTILDENQKVIASYGNRLKLDEDRIFNGELNIDYFSDEEVRDRLETQTNHLSLNILTITKNFLREFRSNSDYDSFQSRLGEEVFTYSYWIGKPIGDTGYLYLSEHTQSIYANDCFLVLISAAVSCAMLFILITVYLWNAISNVITKRYLLKLLLSDNITGGDNYLAFSTLSTNVLSMYKRKEYAIVDFSLMKYQNFCTLYGTAEGEKLLTAMEEALSKYFKCGEAHARVANGDYILLLKKNKQDYVDRISALIRDLPGLLEKPLYKSGSAIKDLSRLSFTAGIYIVEPAMERKDRIRRRKKNIDIDQLYIKAEMARQSLGAESGIRIYNHEMWEKEIWEQKVENKMLDALKNEEFQVYIQPKYHPSTEELVGGEALVRWISPTEGFISPGQFIPIFEKTGFITKLDDYMISHTAALQAKWLSEGKKIVPISINVSRAHFAQPDLADRIKNLVDAYPIPHEYIEIELTESAFFDDKKTILSTVKALQNYGFAVSMDDFGSGYSSLNSLKDLPLNVLKLDAEFFRGEDTDGRGEIIVSEAISLAKLLNMKIVAEGIEKKEQVDFLASKECDMIQGFYFDKPMPADEYVSRMK